VVNGLQDDVELLRVPITRVYIEYCSLGVIPIRLAKETKSIQTRKRGP